MLHKTGNKYITNGTLIHLLSTFQICGQRYCVLITIADSKNISYTGYNGNRYYDPVKVNDPYNLSSEEMKLITNNTPYELYTEPVTV